MTDSGGGAIRMGGTIYSQRLGPIADIQFQVALERFDLGAFVRAEAVAGGLFGQNVFLTSTQGDWVLRGAPHTAWQLPSERFFARLLHERAQVPVPWPYLVDDRDDIFGWSYAIMPRLPGLPLSDRQAAERLPRHDRIAVAQAMAINLAKAHDLTWDYPGEYDLALDSIRPFAQPWAEWIFSETHGWLDSARHSDRTTDADAAWVDNVLTAASEALTAPFQAGIVLRDYGEHNVVVSHSGDGWRVRGMFDLMEASFGDSEMDLSRLVAQYLDQDAELARAYLRQYLELRAPRPGFQARFPAYMLRDRLIVWEYGVRPETPQWWDPALTLRLWAEQYTTAIDRLLEG
jgi:aminoglycoside phosphotransferase (APT) family kinase protein